MDGISTLRPKSDTECNEYGRELCFFVDDVKVEFEKGNSGGDTDGKGEPLGEAGAKESALGRRCGCSGGFVLVKLRSGRVKGCRLKRRECFDSERRKEYRKRKKKKERKKERIQQDSNRQAFD